MPRDRQKCLHIVSVCSPHCMRSFHELHRRFDTKIDGISVTAPYVAIAGLEVMSPGRPDMAGEPTAMMTNPALFRTSVGYLRYMCNKRYFEIRYHETYMRFQTRLLLQARAECLPPAAYARGGRSSRSSET